MENANDIEQAQLLEADLQANIGNDEIQQESVETQSIKSSFLEDLKTSLKLKQNKVEVRGINRQQLGAVISILKAKDTKVKSYYHYRGLYRVTETEPEQLIVKEPVKEGEVPVNKVVVCLEDMFDECMKVHKSVGYQGRSTMEPEANKFYANMTRHVIEVFLKYSKEYQLKKKRTQNHGLVLICNLLN